jgi:hypothetical protein
MSSDNNDDDNGMEDYPALMTTPGAMTTRKQIVAFLHNMHGYLNVPSDVDKATCAYDAHAKKYGLDTQTTIKVDHHHQEGSKNSYDWTVTTVAKIPGTNETVSCKYGSI